MSISFAKAPNGSSADRVRRSTAPQPLNLKIDRQIDKNIRDYGSGDRQGIIERIASLDKEWDIERVLEVNASTFALTGLLVGATVNHKWLMLSGIVLPFLLQH